MDVQGNIRDLKERFGLNHLRGEALEYRPEQWQLINELLSTDGHVALSARTSVGKTVFFLLKALQVIGRGKRAVFTTVRRHLVSQFVQCARELSTLPAEAIVSITGELTPQRRQKLYEQQPALIIGTREAILKDIQRGTFHWEGIELFGTDEVHHSQGKDAYTVLTPILKATSVQRLHMSATLAHNKDRLIALLHDLAVDQVFVLETEREILREHMVTVDLDDELTWAADILQEEARHCQAFLEANLSEHQLQLFEPDVVDKASRVTSLPSYAQRRTLKKRIGPVVADNATAKLCHSKWCELGLLCWLYEGLVTCGRFVFLEDFAYRYAKHRFYPKGVVVRSLEQGAHRGSRLFEKRVVGNQRLWAVFAQLAQGRAYEAFVQHTSWAKLLGSAAEYTLGRDVCDQAGNYFESALREAARHCRGDHPKIQPYLQVLYEYPQHLKAGHILTLTGTRRHTQFLAEAIQEELRGVGCAAAAAYGPRNAQQRRDVAQSLFDFRSGRVNVLMSTDYVREGMDVPRAHVCVEYCVPDSNPIKKVQGRGRVGRNVAYDRADLYYLLTRQSQEGMRLNAARGRIGGMQRATRQRGGKRFYGEEEP